ncbi:hypothetical protein Btru_008616 [Bulinus truncatus]|nr:hypothetical protein Btru_008616 [Bulinus truncatus]
MMSTVVSSVLLVLVLIFCLTVSTKGDFGECPNILTSEGVTTLKHGQRACAPLRGGETDADKGRRFIYCSNGALSEYPCAASLRFDTVSNVCNWPSMSTCQLKGNDIVPLVTATSPESSPTGTTPELTTTKTSTTTTTQKPVPTPTPTSPHTPPDGPCSPLNCKLPDCFCYGGQPNISVQDTSQFIMVTFDDAVTPQNYESYFRNLLVDNFYQLYNPTGCRISGAFYVSHDNTDYSKVMKLWQAGNEIASHTIHHILPDGNKDGDYAQAVAEFCFWIRMVCGRILDLNVRGLIPAERYACLECLSSWCLPCYKWCTGR